MIGFNTGEQYADETQMALGIPLGSPRMAAGKSSDEKGTKVPPPENEPFIDRNHDVPLAASALHRDGQFYGIAIDKDAPEPAHPAFHQGVYLHEKTEFDHMKNLVDAGQDPVSSYHEAHDRIATPIETAFIRATAAREGRDPDQFLDEHKAYWRDVTSKAQEPPFNRHPDAHTTTYGLDEAELPQHKIQLAASESKFRPFNPMEPQYQPPGGHGHIETPPAESTAAARGRPSTQETPPGYSSEVVPRITPQTMRTGGDRPQPHELEPHLRGMGERLLDPVYRGLRDQVDEAYRAWHTELARPDNEIIPQFRDSLHRHATDLGDDASRYVRNNLPPPQREAPRREDFETPDIVQHTLELARQQSSLDQIPLRFNEETQTWEDVPPGERQPIGTWTEEGVRRPIYSRSTNLNPTPEDEEQLRRLMASPEYQQSMSALRQQAQVQRDIPPTAEQLEARLTRAREAAPQNIRDFVDDGMGRLAAETNMSEEEINQWALQALERTQQTLGTQEEVNRQRLQEETRRRFTSINQPDWQSRVENRVLRKFGKQPVTSPAVREAINNALSQAYQQATGQAPLGQMSSANQNIVGGQPSQQAGRTLTLGPRLPKPEKLTVTRSHNTSTFFNMHDEKGRFRGSINATYNSKTKQIAIHSIKNEQGIYNTKIAGNTLGTKNLIDARRQLQAFYPEATGFEGRNRITGARHGKAASGKYEQPKVKIRKEKSESQ